MPNIRAVGTVRPIRQKKKWSYDPNQGLKVEVPYECVGENLNGIAQQLIANRIAFSVETSGAVSRLILSASGGQAGIPNLATDEWQVTGNEIQKSIWEHWVVARDVTDANIKTIEAGIGATPPTSSADIGLTGTALLLYNYLKRGQTHYALGQYVVRHTTNVSNDSTFNVSDANVERVYSFGQLNTELTSARLWTFPLPQRLRTKLANIPAPPFDPAGYLWGWRKLPSTEHTAAGSRISITTEYWLEQWPLWIYPQAT